MVMESFAPLPTHPFRGDRLIIALLMAAAAVLAALAWLADHPQHDPRAPLHIDDPVGWATARKLASLRDDPSACRDVLMRAGIGFTDLPPAGEGACRRTDRLRLAPATQRGLALRPDDAETTCALGAAMAWWLHHGLQPAAGALFDSQVVAIEHLGTSSCRRVNGADSGRWSEHATANAIDVSAFVLADGQRISVEGDWPGNDRTPDAQAQFLNAARDSACAVFGTVLSLDYNARHADHLHLDQARRGIGGYCR